MDTLKNQYNQAITQKEKEFAALSYMWIFAVLIYFSPESKSNYVKHHARQGVFLFVLSIIFYFFPGYLSFLNVFIVFLMILGIIEAAIGHKYDLPIISDWLEGRFNASHFKMFSSFIKKEKNEEQPLKSTNTENLLELKMKIFEENEKNDDKSINDFLRKTVREKWIDKMKIFEKSVKTMFEHKHVLFENFNEGFNIIAKNKHICTFGGVEKNIFHFAYLKNVIIFPGDKTIGGWEVKEFNVNKVDKKNFEAIVSLILDYVDEM